MTACTKSFSVLLASLASLAVARADEPQAPNRELQYQVSTELHERYGRVVRPGFAEPSYVAVLRVKRAGPDRSVLAQQNPGAEAFDTPAGRSASDEQRRYTGMDQFPQYFRLREQGPVETFEIWSPSEADARKMAEAVIQWADAKASQKRSEAEKKLADYRAIRVKVEKEIPELEAKVAAERAERDEMQKVMAYGAGDAARDILELDKALRAVAIDMAAIQAKMEAIAKLRGRYNQQAMLDFLAQISATQDIDMAGVLARKSALEAERKKTVHFRDLSKQHDEDAENLRSRYDQHKALERDIPTLEKTLADLPTSMRPLELEGKVVIYRTGAPPPGLPATSMPGGGGPQGPGMAR